MEYILNGMEIKALEESANQNGVSFLRLMENAGAACAKEIRSRFPADTHERVSIFCGKGKNGGDGFVIARKLMQSGYDVQVFLMMGEPKAEEAKEMFSRIREMEVSTVFYDQNSKTQKWFISSSNIIVDALFGTGFSGTPCEALTDFLAILKETNAKVISIDLPSGLLTNETAVPTEPVQADLTLSVMAYKPSLVAYPTRSYAGEVKIVRIGIPEDLYAPFQNVCTMQKEDIKALFPPIKEDSNKGDFGKLLLVAGSYQMPGAAVLSSSAAIECGTGLVRLAFPDCAYAAVTASAPEKVLLPLISNREGRISSLNEKRLIEALKDASACLVGCGLGIDYDTKAVVTSLLQHAEKPIILDADGINAMADCIEIIQETKAPVILTPHPGEAARLLHCTIEEVQNNRIKAAKAIQEKTNAVVILKGNGTIITADGQSFVLNLTGNAGLATAGSGDVLAGMVAAFVCKGLSPKEAAVAGAYIHGVAGELVSKAYSKCGTTPTKLLSVLPKLMSAFE